MTKAKSSPLIGADGEVRELTAEDMKLAVRGRPPMPSEAKKVRVNLMLDPDVVAALSAQANKSAFTNDALRKKLGL